MLPLQASDRSFIHRSFLSIKELRSRCNQEPPVQKYTASLYDSEHDGSFLLLLVLLFLRWSFTRLGGRRSEVIRWSPPRPRPLPRPRAPLTHDVELLTNSR